MKKGFLILLACVAVLAATAATASAAVTPTTVVPVTPTKVYGITVTGQACTVFSTHSEGQQDTLDIAITRYGGAVEVGTGPEGNPHYSLDFDEDGGPADGDDAIATAGGCPGAAVFNPGASGDFLCNYPAGNPGILAPDWNTAIIDMMPVSAGGLGYWKPFAVAGSLPQGQGETIKSGGKSYYLTCDPKKGSGTSVTDGGNGPAADVAAILAAPGWEEVASS